MTDERIEMAIVELRREALVMTGGRVAVIEEEPARRILRDLVAADRERIAKIIEWNTEEREIDYPSVEISAEELIEAVRAGTPIEHFLRKELDALTLHPRGQCACGGEGWCRWCRQSKAQEEIDALAGKP